ncbi:phosphoribosyltransferase family protein [Candidatus Vidania fulgoroideorum]
MNKERKNNKINIISNTKINKKNIYIIVDDIIDTGNTIYKIVKFLKKRLVKKIFVYSIHAILSNKIILKKKISICSTNTLMRKHKNIKYICIKKKILNIIKKL